MANPLAMYVPILPDGWAQAAAADACKNFVAGVKAGLDKYKIVHYALLTPIKTADGKKIDAILLHTSFDKDMEPYLSTFWEDPGTKIAFQGLAKISRIPVADVETFNGFQRFITENNLAPDPASLYQAYDASVEDILEALKH